MLKIFNWKSGRNNVQLYWITVKVNQRQDYSRPYKIYSRIRKPHYAPRKSTTEARLSLSPEEQTLFRKVVGQSTGSP